MNRNRLIAVDGLFHSHTEKGVLVGIKEQKLWFPKSQLENEPDWEELEVGEQVEFLVPEWLAEEKGLI